MPAEYDLIGRWSEVKLDILREYAVPYSTILTANNLYHLYIDGFAGRGSHISRTTGEPVPGSPLNALRANPPFREYHFIDQSQLAPASYARTPTHAPRYTCTRVTAMRFS